ncbi:MAG: FAD-dependent oxidoreductase [Leptolyngbya sp.]|nr:FAD-dependent oxidoreductase [Leptolyngbya sp.]
MKIAIIGGGASGMIAAYLLDRRGHEVTVYERQAMLGGHIRTLNQNIFPSTDCPAILEMGVLEFPVEFTHFLQLMEELEVPLEPVEVGSGLFFQDGRHFLSQTCIGQNFHGLEKWREMLHIDSLYARSIGLWLKAHLTSMHDLHGQSMGQYLAPPSTQATWLKLLTMYSYSMAYETIDAFPADLAIPALRRYVFSPWVRIKGGVYSYIQKILDQFSGQVSLNTQILAIHRSNQAVQIRGLVIPGDQRLTWNGQPLGQSLGQQRHEQRRKQPFEREFDRVIFATPPDQVLRLLADPRPEEVRRFSAWQPNDITTTLHQDPHLYQPYHLHHGSEFDFFQTPTGWGYNAYLNQLCGLPAEPAYYLAFNLEKGIAPEKIIHRQPHHTPLYTLEAFRSVDEVRATNGDHKTYHVGAYLGDGLHEGATTSAMQVARAIGPAEVLAIPRIPCHAV